VKPRANPKPDGIPVPVAELWDLHSIYSPKATDDLK
jgi:hypothetical protein